MQNVSFLIVRKTSRFRLVAIAFLLMGALGIPALAEILNGKQSVSELLARRAPQLVGRIGFSDLGKDPTTGADVFEVEDTAPGKVEIRGSSGVAMAMGVNWYLKNICHTQLSWCGSQMDIQVAKLGNIPGKKVRVVCPHEHVAYFNYCTLSYTAAWWDWERWEWEIDFMALNGVNMPLATVGLEAVWYEALVAFGFTDLEARSFLTGPAHLAWQWMANMDAFDGPLPKSWIDSRAKLGRQILEREKAFGMTPIQQGFSGHVPGLFKEKFPDAGIVQKERWCDLPGAFQLDPVDPLFAKFGRVFLESERKVLGLSGLFAADPFHESTPPRPGAEYLKQVGEAIQGLFSAVDPKSVWVMQSWSIRKDIAQAVPIGRLLVLDLGGANWKGTAGFWGHDFVVGQLHNFGGRINLHGDLAGVAENPFVKAKQQYPGAKGMGLFMEGIEQNPVFYDLVFDMVPRSEPVDLDRWLGEYVTRRYGSLDTHCVKAWDILKRTAYARGTNGVESSSIVAARPALDVKKSGPNAGFNIPYPVTELETAWRELLKGGEKCGASDGYRFDVVDLGRQVLSNLGQDLHRDVRMAFDAKDAARLDLACKRFQDLLRDIDALLETRSEYRFGRWIQSARRWGQNEEERAYFDRDASALVTLWGPIDQPQIVDYSWREWSGLIREFYLPRWQKFHEFLAGKLKAGEDYSEVGLKQVHGREAWRANAFYEGLADWETAWVRRSKADWKGLPEQSSLLLAAALAEKWAPDLNRVSTPEYKVAVREWSRKKHEAKTGARVFGEWTPDVVKQQWVELDLDASTAVTDEGLYEVTFEFQKGASALAVEWVALLQDGREVARETHPGKAGKQSEGHAYRLKLDAVAFGAKYGFRIRVRGMSSSDTTGLVTLKKAGLKTAEEPRK
ncbi:MAG: alpha-N-acetylglucosaminidase [Verrucomicrobiota bacterium]